MKKRRFLKACALLAVGMMLAACSSGGGASSSGGSSSAGGGTGSTGSGDSGLTGDLVYYCNWNQTETQGQVITDAVKAFTEQNPGVNIKVVYNGRENKKVVLPALESGQQIDLFDQSIDLVINSWGDYLLDLTPYFEESYATTDGKPYKDAVMQAPLDLLQTLKPGGYYGVPYQPSLYAFMYNKEHFEKAGIEQVPTTWDEFLAACEKLKAAGYTPLTDDDAYIDILFGMHLTRLKGEEWVDQCVNDTTGAMWDDPAVLTALQDMRELVDKGYCAPTMTSNKYPAGQQEVAMGDVSMYFNGTYLVNEVMATTGPDFRWGAFNYPTVDGQGDLGDVLYGCQLMGINKNCKSPDAAFAFAVFLTTGEWDKTLAEKTYGVPVGGTTDWPVQLEDAKAIFENATSRIVSGTAVRNNTEKAPIVKEVFVKVLNGELTPEAAVDELKK